MEYDREDARAIEPKERIKNFNEFHIPLSKERQQIQGARCMNCGVPFCQAGMNIMGMTSGCPLHNLVPEWNDLVYTGNWEQAYNRLKKTNNFPEFTSRYVRHSARRLHLRALGRSGDLQGELSTELSRMRMSNGLCGGKALRKCAPARRSR